MPLPSLREWSSTVDAVLAGRQTLLIRKGGISEGSAGFSADHERFVLLPTLFHQHHSTPPPLPSPLLVHVLCDLLLAVEVPSCTDLSPLAPFHTYDPAQLGVRVSYKPEKPLTLLALRPYRILPALKIDPSTLPATCRSWLVLDLPTPTHSEPIVTAVLSDLVEVLQSMVAHDVHEETRRRDNQEKTHAFQPH